MRKMVMAVAVLALVGGIGIFGTGPAAAERGWSGHKDDEPTIKSSVRIPSEEEHLVSLAKLTIEDAIKRVRETETGAVIAAELEAEDGYLYWSVEFARADGMYEATIDPGNGKILSVERDDDECESEGEEEDDEDEDEEEGGRGGWNNGGRGGWNRGRGER
ncbi:MAG: PepSY domain-containing protein [Candidatus Hydrogenedentota bacterium]